MEYDSYTKMDVSRVARVCKVISLGVLCHLSCIEKYYSIPCLYHILHCKMSFLSGRLGWAEDAAEEVDFFSKSKARLSRSKQQPASSGPGCFPLVAPVTGQPVCFTLSLPRNCKYEIFLFLLRQFIVDSIEFNDSVNVVQCINDKTLFLIHRDSSQYSAVCAYKIKDIKTMFSKGKFMAPVTVETSFVKWVMYSGDVP